MLKLMYITNTKELMEIADSTGVDRVIVDLEKIGKGERQRGWNSVISNHTIDDVTLARKTLKHAELMVRINSMNEGSEKEINDVIDRGADIVMLPYFKTADEVRRFVEIAGGRTQVSILVETKEAVENIDEILSIKGIDEVHIGLNDLSHSYGKPFLFEMFPNGVVDYVIAKLKEHGYKNYGIGGIARLNHGLIPAEDIIAEHYRLGSSCAILSRAFCNPEEVRNMSSIREIFETEIARIRNLEKIVTEFDDEMFEYCRKRFNEKVRIVSEEMEKKAAK